MDRRQKKRLIIFLFVPLLAVILFVTDDLTIRVITLAVIIIYVAFIIFFRDTSHFDKNFLRKNDEDLTEPVGDLENFSESFQIVSRTKNIEVITADNYTPDFRSSKTTLRPPDLKERFEEIANESLPQGIGNDGQFTFVLEKMLAVIKEALCS